MLLINDIMIRIAQLLKVRDFLPANFTKAKHTHTFRHTFLRLILTWLQIRSYLLPLLYR